MQTTPITYHKHMIVTHQLLNSILLVSDTSILQTKASSSSVISDDESFSKNIVPLGRYSNIN